MAHANKLSVILSAIGAAVETSIPLINQLEDKRIRLTVRRLPPKQKRFTHAKRQIEICAAGRHSAHSEMDGDNIVNHHHSRHISSRAAPVDGKYGAPENGKPGRREREKEAPSANAIRILSRRCTCLPPTFPDKQDQVGRNLPAETSATYGRFHRPRPAENVK